MSNIISKYKETGMISIDQPVGYNTMKSRLGLSRRNHSVSVSISSGNNGKDRLFGAPGEYRTIG